MSPDHYLDLVADPELRAALRCTAPPDADCRRRPPDWEDQESWTEDEATETGHDCWATEWVDAVGIEDAVRVGTEAVLASIPVAVHYDEGVSATVVDGPTDAEVEAAAEEAIADTAALLAVTPLHICVPDETGGLDQ